MVPTGQSIAKMEKVLGVKLPRPEKKKVSNEWYLNSYNLKFNDMSEMQTGRTEADLRGDYEKAYT